LKIKEELEQLIQYSRKYYERGWMFATAGNLSIYDSESGLMWITASGKDKSKLTPDDFISVSLATGETLGDSSNKPSAETSIHISLYNSIHDARAILHVHTENSCVLEFGLSQKNEKSYATLPNTEIIKAFGDFKEEPNFKMLVTHNFSDVPKIANLVKSEFDTNKPEVPFFLIENHGLTVWGKSVYEANKNLEATDFLMKVMARRQK
jgi:methylthioribulose-1-phosphate dehydratase